MASRFCARPYTRVPHLEGWKAPVRRWGSSCPRVGSRNDPYYPSLAGWESARAVSGYMGVAGVVGRFHKGRGVG